MNGRDRESDSVQLYDVMMFMALDCGSRALTISIVIGQAYGSDWYIFVIYVLIRFNRYDLVVLGFIETSLKNVSAFVW